MMLTYGGDPISQGMMALAKKRGIPVVFGIHNFAYTGLLPFSHVDYCIVPSEFARRHYRDKIGLDCHVLPYPLDWDRCRVRSKTTSLRGLLRSSIRCWRKALARSSGSPRRWGEGGPISRSSWSRAGGTARPDRPRPGSGRRGQRPAHAQYQRSPTILDPTRIIVMPSLWWENQPLVAIESMINGIPVIGSDRGGIPEALGDCGFVLPLPARLTPTTRDVPEAAEVEPWVETIIRLWDDRALYEEQSLRAREEARRWHPDRLRPLYADFFRDVRHQAGPPMISSPSGSPA